MRALCRTLCKATHHPGAFALQLGSTVRRKSCRHGRCRRHVRCRHRCRYCRAPRRAPAPSRRALPRYLDRRRPPACTTRWPLQGVPTAPRDCPCRQVEGCSVDALVSPPRRLPRPRRAGQGAQGSGPCTPEPTGRLPCRPPLPSGGCISRGPSRPPCARRRQCLPHPLPQPPQYRPWLGTCRAPPRRHARTSRRRGSAMPRQTGTCRASGPARGAGRTDGQDPCSFFLGILPRLEARSGRPAS